MWGQVLRPGSGVRLLGSNPSLLLWQTMARPSALKTHMGVLAKKEPKCGNILGKWLN